MISLNLITLTRSQYSLLRQETVKHRYRLLDGVTKVAANIQRPEFKTWDKKVAGWEMATQSFWLQPSTFRLLRKKCKFNLHPLATYESYNQRRGTHC